MKKLPVFRRSSGVLLNISSLPGAFGIGCFSREAEDFADMLADMRFGWWQILPLTTVGWGNSPYSGISTYAGNRLYISPDGLKEDGLLTEDEARTFVYHGSPYTADYAFAKRNSEAFLRLAFSKIDDKTRAEIAAFEKENRDWVSDYALFMALAKDRGVEWRKWEHGYKFREKSALATARRELKDDVDFYVFEQYEFYRQWAALKKKINDKGIGIIGDLPFYVSDDSVDVWAHTDLFQLDNELNPTAIAGVPPDAFAPDGQVWGNCLYDFDKMKADGYSWWRSRIKHCAKMYDALRLDHFRAFYDYFAIPSCDRHTAVNGKWIKGAGMDLLDLIKSDNPETVFIAEDLGDIDDECREFIDNSGFPTMRVFQFGFDGTPSVHMPYRYQKNDVAYTGTHDNNTTLGWLYEIHPDARAFALKYCNHDGRGWDTGGTNCTSVKAVIKTVAASAACLSVFPVQDILCYGADTRMNIPGIADGNWTYRVTNELLSTADRNFYRDVNNTYGRTGKGIE